MRLLMTGTAVFNVDFGRRSLFIGDVGGILSNFALSLGLLKSHRFHGKCHHHISTYLDAVPKYLGGIFSYSVNYKDMLKNTCKFVSSSIDNQYGILLGFDQICHYAF
uniref:Uncharacterized protein n=1 Tax=Arundo donax TaxID=35708 RepID=A0A0A8ZZD4_ARUDO